MKNNTASAAGAAMPKCHKTRRDLPPFESENYLTVFILCHHRMTALYRIAEGRGRPDDRSMVTGCEELLAMDGWTPRDFGFVDPPTFDVQPNTGTVFAALDATSGVRFKVMRSTLSIRRIDGGSADGDDETQRRGVFGISREAP